MGRAPRISAYAKKIARDRDRVLHELAAIVEDSRDPLLSDTDIRRLHLRRQTLTQIYQCQSTEIQELQKQELIDGVKRVEAIWGAETSSEDLCERESSFAVSLSDGQSKTAH